MEAQDDVETPTDTMVSREDTTGVEEACDACVEWGHTSSPAPGSGFCNPTPSTAREEHVVGGLQCNLIRDPYCSFRSASAAFLLMVYPVLFCSTVFGASIYVAPDL